MLLNGIHLTNCYSVFRIHLICLKNGKFATFGFLSFQLKLQYFKYCSSIFSENSHAFPENIVLIYSKIFLIRNSSFQENAKTKVYALEDSLGVINLAPYKISIL